MQKTIAKEKVNEVDSINVGFRTILSIIGGVSLVKEEEMLRVMKFMTGKEGKGDQLIAEHISLCRSHLLSRLDPVFSEEIEAETEYLRNSMAILEMLMPESVGTFMKWDLAYGWLGRMEERWGKEYGEFLIRKIQE
jgi:hypothetical protein